MLCTPFLQASALIERAVERSFPATGRISVKVDTFYGGIQVTPSEGSEVKVVVHESLDVKTEDAADRVLRDLDLAMESSSDGAVSIRAQTKRSVRWTWEKWPPVALSIEISVPKTCDLDLLSREGGIVVGNVRGNVVVRALQGAIFIGEVDGSVTAWSAQGDVSVTACTEKLNVTVRNGNVVVGRAFGPSEIVGSGGAVEVQTMKGPLHADVDGGELKVGFAYSVSGDTELRSTGGDMVLTFDPRSSFNIDARASSSSKVVARDLALSVRKGELGTRQIEAELNGGGSRILARNNSGGIRLLGVPGVSESR